MKNDTPTEGQYAGDLVSNAGKREMGPKCGSLPRNAGELAGLHLPIIRERLKAGRPWSDFFMDCCKDYGPVFVVWLLHIEHVILADVTAARQLLNDALALKSEQVFRPVQYPFGYRFIGNAQVAINDDELWRRRHKLVSPFFSRKNLHAMVASFNTTIDKFIAYVDKSAVRGDVIAMRDTFPLLTSAVIAKVALGADIGTLEGDCRLNVALDDVLEGLFEQFRDPLSNFLPAYRNTWKQVKEGCSVLRQAGHQWMLKRQKEILEGKEFGDDILGFLLKATAESGEYSPEEIIDGVVDIFFGGHKTTSIALTFALKEILANPQIETRVVEEVDRVLNGRQFISSADLASMQFLSCVFKEALRRHTVAGAVHRILHAPMNVAGYNIPAGTWVEVNMHIMHMREDYWPNPLTFDPDRFMSLTSEDGGVPFLPFSGGPRVCSGRIFAELEIKMTLARLFQMFTIQLEKENSLSSPYEEYTTKLLTNSKDPIKCKFTRRSAQEHTS